MKYIPYRDINMIYDVKELLPLPRNEVCIIMGVALTDGEGASPWAPRSRILHPELDILHTDPSAQHFTSTQTNTMIHR